MKRARFRASPLPIYHWKWLFNDSYFFPMVSLNKWIVLSWPPLPSLLVLLIEGNRRLLVRWVSSSFWFPACLPQSAHWQSKVNPRGWDCSPEERELHFWICAVIFVGFTKTTTTNQSGGGQSQIEAIGRANRLRVRQISNYWSGWNCDQIKCNVVWPMCFDDFMPNLWF